MNTEGEDWRQPLFKIVLLGECGVGKSSLFLRIKDNVFGPSLQPTMGIESCVKNIRVDGDKVSLAVWDTAGLEKFKTLTRNYYRNTHATILVYDLNDPASLQYLSKWANDAIDFAPNAVRFLMGNKKDLEKMILTESLENFQYAHNCEATFYTSAKTGEGINDAMYTIAEKLLRVYKTPLFYESHYEGSVEINKFTERRRRSVCC